MIARSAAAHIFVPPPAGPVARREVLDLIRRLEKIDSDLDGTGPRLLQKAVTDALEELR